MKIVGFENTGQDSDQVDGELVTVQNWAGEFTQGLGNTWRRHVVCQTCENSLTGTRGNWLSQASIETQVLAKDSVVG